MKVQLWKYTPLWGTPWKYLKLPWVFWVWNTRCPSTGVRILGWTFYFVK